MEEWGLEKKWLMINQDHQAELLGTGMRASKLKEAALERTSLDISRLPTVAPTPSTSSPLARSHTQIQVRRGENPKASKSSPSPTSGTPNGSFHKPSLYSINTNLSDTSQSTTNSSVKRSPTATRSPSPLIKPKLNVDHYFDTFSNDESSPEFYIKKFLDPNLRSVTTKIAASLEVSLRTRSIE